MEMLLHGKQILLGTRELFDAKGISLSEEDMPEA